MESPGNAMTHSDVLKSAASIAGALGATRIFAAFDPAGLGAWANAVAGGICTIGMAWLFVMSKKATQAREQRAADEAQAKDSLSAKVIQLQHDNMILSEALGTSKAALEAVAKADSGTHTGITH